jgi:thiamine-phosphate pyrophosphorylase
VRTPRVLLITDDAYADDVVLRAIEAVGRVAEAGAFGVQLRDKTRTPADRAAWARRLRAWTGARGASLVINGDAALAREVGADGVHYPAATTAAGLEEGAGLWRSVAAHRDDDVVRARDAKLDAVLVSPIFDTPGKGPARGVAAIARAVTLARGELEVIALGGIGALEAPACFAAGARGVAMIRGLLASGAPESVARAALDAR